MAVAKCRLFDRMLDLQVLSRLFLLSLIWFSNNNAAFSYDSLETAIRFHQSSQFERALPIFIELAAKFKVRRDLPNYTLCQTNIADIIRTFGGPNLAIELLEANEKAMMDGLEVPSSILAQNFLAKAEAFRSAANLAQFKSAILKSINLKRRARLSDKHFAEDFLLLARYYKDMPDRNDSCLYWATRSLACAKSDRTFSLYVLPRIYNMLGHYYHPASVGYFVNKEDSLNNHFRISRAYYDSALRAVLTQPIPDPLLLGQIYYNLGNSFSNQGRATIDKALSCYRKSIKLYQDFGNPVELASKDWVVGRAFERLGLPDSAITQFQIGIRRLIPDFRPKSVDDLPSLQPTLSDSWFISLLVLKSNNYYYRYRDSQNIADLLLAYQHFIHLLKFHKYLVAQSLNEEELIHWSHLFGSNAYQSLVMVGYDLYKSTGSMTYLQDVYGLIAASKYAFLNRNIIEPETTYSIRSSLLIDERKLVLSNIHKSIPQLSESRMYSILPPVTTATDSLSLSQIDLAREFLDTLNFSTLANELRRENGALIDYYVRDDDLYTITISQNSFDVSKAKFPSNLVSLVSRLNRNLMKLSSIEYSILSSQLYKATVASSLMVIPRSVTKLIICPDHILQEVPWDALATDTVGRSYKTINYLMNKYVIRTVMTPVHLNSTFGKARDSFIGIVPDFSSSRRFTAIPFSTRLVSSKANHFDGTFEETFNNDPIDANILHIASHVTIDPVHPYNSSIHLGDYDSLTMTNLSSKMIKANVIVLNGCLTGSGQYVQSEGTISMTRAFYLVGAKSVVSTLWSVDDKATADVLKVWYDHIEDGEDLDIALYKAKLDYIRNAGSEESANPYYWAGLQLTGSSIPIVQSNRSAFLLGIGLTLLTITTLLGILKFRLKN